MMLGAFAAGMQPAGAGQGGGSPMIGLVMMMMVFAIFYVLIIMPQRKKQKKHQEEVQKLTAGTQIITAGGIVGTVVGFRKDDRLGDLIELKIASNTNIAITKGAVGQILSASDKPLVK